jgi:uncharacterized protein DUF4833
MATGADVGRDARRERRALMAGARGLVLGLLCITASASGVAGPDTCPAHLFVVGRSKNANIVAYDANLGQVGSDPVTVYWLLDGDENRREELTRVQRDRAYGVDVAPADSPGTYYLVFKADNKRRLTVRMANGCPVATTQIGGHTGILRKLFVQAKEDSVLPKVEFVEFFGEDVDTGEALYEKYLPGK